MSTKGESRKKFPRRIIMGSATEAKTRGLELKNESDMETRNDYASIRLGNK